MSSAGVLGPDARKFLKFLYKSSRERNCWGVGSGQPQIQSTWSTLFASTYWDMRLSMACTAMPAEVVGRIIVRDFNPNLATDGSRQPLSDSNVPAYGVPGRGGRSWSFLDLFQALVKRLPVVACFLFLELGRVFSLPSCFLPRCFSWCFLRWVV